VDFLLNLDYHWLITINRDWANGFFDAVLPWWRDKYTWIPLYLVLLGWFIWQFRKRVWIAITFLLLTVGLCDFSASSVVKPQVNRLRPCNNTELADDIIVRIECGPGKSFPSAHATNHFGIAIFLITLFGRAHRVWLVPAGLFWAASISYAQVYVGLHYPLDVLAGYLLRCTFGFAIGVPARNILKKKMAI
jgi:undecaprenyl-diphosphatase